MHKRNLQVAIGALVVAFALIAAYVWWGESGGTTQTATLINLAYTALTGALVLIGFTQLRVSQEATKAALEDGAIQRRKWATLQACDRYDMDPEITAAVRFLRRFHPFSSVRLAPPSGIGADFNQLPTPSVQDPAWAGLTNDQRYTMSAGLLLNYFDSIAIGINQQFYDEDICRDHIGNIVRNWIQMLRSTAPDTFDEIMRVHYPTLNAMSERWHK